MASPDFKRYIDLTADIRTPDDIYDDAVAYAQIALPEFVPRVGTVEAGLLQAVALMASFTIGSINTMTDGLMEGILKFIGLNRLEQSYGTIDVEFQTINPDGSIDADFYVIYQTTVNGAFVEYPFYTTSAVTAETGQTTISATLTSMTPGIIPQIGLGTELILAQPSADVISCTTTSLIAQGSDSETDDEYFRRGTSYLTTLNATFVRPEQVESYILSTYSNVHRCKVYDLTKPVSWSNVDKVDNTSSGSGDIVIVELPTNSESFFANADFSSGLFKIINQSSDSVNIIEAPTGFFVPDNENAITKTFEYTNIGPHSTRPISVLDMSTLALDTHVDAPGYFVIFMCDVNGDPISSTIKDAIYDDIANKILAGLTFEIHDAIPVDINYEITINLKNGYSASSVAASVVEEIELYISPNKWPDWLNTVRYYDIAAALSSVAGVQRVTTITSNVPTYSQSTICPGNELLVNELASGTEVYGHSLLYAGCLPRASVQVIVE